MHIFYFTLATSYKSKKHIYQGKDIDIKIIDEDILGNGWADLKMISNNPWEPT